MCQVSTSAPARSHAKAVSSIPVGEDIIERRPGAPEDLLPRDVGRDARLAEAASVEDKGLQARIPENPGHEGQFAALGVESPDKQDGHELTLTRFAQHCGDP